MAAGVDSSPKGSKGVAILLNPGIKSKPQDLGPFERKVIELKAFVDLFGNYNDNLLIKVFIILFLRCFKFLFNYTTLII